MAPQCRVHSRPIINPPAPHAGADTHFSPVKYSSYQSAAVAGRRFAAAPPTKGARAAISSVFHESGGRTSAW